MDFGARWGAVGGVTNFRSYLSFLILFLAFLSSQEEEVPEEPEAQLHTWSRCLACSSVLWWFSTPLLTNSCRAPPMGWDSVVDAHRVAGLRNGKPAKLCLTLGLY